jgi:ElaB/YqjD/DUF883 family membrane-anchored ribosome-binding protein
VNDIRLKQEETIMGTLDKTSDYVHGAADYMHDAADYVQENAEKIASATSHAAEALGEKGEQLLDAEQKLMKSCRNYVRANPVTSLGIMLAVGFVMGRMFSSER